MPKVILLAVILLALSLLICLLFKSGGQSENKFGISVGSFMENVSVVNRKSGDRQWSLKTKRALLSEDGSTAEMKDVILTLPSEEMTVLADSGLYNMDSNDLSFSGDVKAVTEKYTIRTDTARLKKETISSDDKVVIEGRGFRINGTGLKASQKKIRLLNDVTAVFN
jgi:LPS export ABC transporter protein LptC